MLHLLDESLERFLRTVVPLPAREVDVAFDAPDRDWAAGLSRPTVNLYLWDVRLNTGERDLGMEEVTDGDGRKQRRSPRPRVDCRFLVTAWTTEVRDEHALLGRVLVALLNHSELESEYLQGALAALEPLPSVELRAGSASENPDFWSALGGQLKPALDAVITLTVDAALMREVGPPIDELRLRQRNTKDGASEEKVILKRLPEH
jgi:hypothetical protein